MICRCYGVVCEGWRGRCWVCALGTARPARTVVGLCAVLFAALVSPVYVRVAELVVVG